MASLLDYAKLLAFGGNSSDNSEAAAPVVAPVQDAKPFRSVQELPVISAAPASPEGIIEALKPASQGLRAVPRNSQALELPVTVALPAQKFTHSVTAMLEQEMLPDNMQRGYSMNEAPTRMLPTLVELEQLRPRIVAPAARVQAPLPVIDVVADAVDERAIARAGGEPVRASIVFNGCYTVIGPRGHRTFDIRTVIDRGGSDFTRKNKGKRTLSMMVGADNETSFEMFAWVDESRAQLTGKYLKANGVAPAGLTGKKAELYKYAAKYAAMLFRLAAGGSVDGYRIELAGSCLRCNRKLTNPESIATGIGPECASKAQASGF